MARAELVDAYIGGLTVPVMGPDGIPVTRRLPDELAIRTAYIRVFLIGLALQIFLQRFSQGILPERRPAGAPPGEDASDAGESRENR